MARTIAIWVFGLLASAIIGGLVASRLEPAYSNDWGVWGALAGMLTFACLRLWLGAPSKNWRTSDESRKGNCSLSCIYGFLRARTLVLGHRRFELLLRRL